MGISRFFVGRPIFAWVLAIMVMMAGAGAMLSLPIAQYPDIAPPSVMITATYPGASASTVETSVTQVIEQELIGLDNLLYFSSTSDSSGTATITVTFAKGTNPNIAQVQVQNKVQEAMTSLPSEVQTEGVPITKSAGDNLLVVSIYDTGDKATDADISDYLVSNFEDQLARVNGVGEVVVFGSEYAMRIWLDPVKLAARQLMPSDIEAAVEAQNVDLSAGQLGQLPQVPGQRLNAVVMAKSRLQTPAQFRAIVVKSVGDGSVVHLSDVARIEMGQEDYTSVSHLNGHPASGMAIRLASGADALSTAVAVKARVAELAKAMPHGYAVAFPMDSSTFIRLSIQEVEHTLLIAIVLVVVVMFVFLQSWRATLVPAIAVPVVLLGTFGVLSVLGYSLNTLTLFGMVLAIGLLVDDAIVVVENVERIMHEEGLDPPAATIRSMDEIGSALIGVALALSAVMLPMAFFGGSLGVIYRQFSVTIVSAMALSVLVALILSPALCATILKPRPCRDGQRGLADRFNAGFDRLTGWYVRRTGGVIRRPVLSMLVYALLVAAMVVLFLRLPTSFLPSEDQGQIMAQYTLPGGATIERTENARKAIDSYFGKTDPGLVPVIFGVTGTSFAGSGQNTGQEFATLAPFNKRTSARDSVDSIVAAANKAFANYGDGQISIVTPPTIHGLGDSNGFVFELLNSSGMSETAFAALRDKLVAIAQKDPKLTQVRSNALPDTPQMRVSFDDAKLTTLGLTDADATATLSSAWGSTYINQFVDRGRVKQVYMQADAPFRMHPEDLSNWYVRASTTSTAAGASTPPTSIMVPFSSFTTESWSLGANTVSRFDGEASYEIDGDAADGFSSGQAMAEMVALQQRNAPGTAYAWSGLSYQEQKTSGEALPLYAISVVVVFLCLAALYESWSVPFAVLMVIPLGVIGAVLAVTLRGLDNNIYLQVGLLTTIGLSAKNAILIVEFAETARRDGRDLLQAALEAARIRLRPILMTSIAFIAGVVPLAISSGAGAQSRIAIGTAVLGGMISATLLAVFAVPMFFVLVSRLFHRATTGTGTP